MRIITIRQPWAQLIALGIKTFETRSWSTPYRGPVLIHAGKNKGDPWEPAWGPLLSEPGSALLRNDVTPLPLGKVIAVADITDCLPVYDPYDDLRSVRLAKDGHKRGVAAGRALGVVSAEELVFIDDQRSYGNWEPGNWAWQLDNVRPLDEPIAWKGALGLREAPPELVDLVGAEIEVVS